ASTLGLMSYSMYLWHWPIISLQKYYLYSGELPLKNSIATFFSTLVLSYFSLKFIETPIRKSKISFWKSLFLFFIIPSIVISSVFTYSEKTGGIPERYGDKWSNMFLETAYLYTPFCHNTVIGNCVFGDKNTSPTFIVMGDSHAGHYVPMIDEFAKKNSLAFEERTSDACFPLIDTSEKMLSESKFSISNECRENIEYFSKQVDNYKNVVLIGAWSIYYKNIPNFDDLLSDTIKKLSSDNKNIYIFEQVPAFKKGSYIHIFRQRFSPFGGDMDFSKIDFKSMLSARDGGNDDYIDANEKVSLLLKKLDKDNVHFVTPISNIPKISQNFPIYNGRLIYKDDAHLNEVGSRDLFLHNQEMLNNFLK
ncbi:acyltransferase family protein, partial [Citrobacter portucalensis]